jgi:hypothetical protein
MNVSEMLKTAIYMISEQDQKNSEQGIYNKILSKVSDTSDSIQQFPVKVFRGVKGVANDVSDAVSGNYKTDVKPTTTNEIPKSELVKNVSKKSETTDDHLASVTKGVSGLAAGALIRRKRAQQ